MPVKDEVRKALHDNREEFLSGEQLSEKLGVSRAAIWKAVKALREEGLCIEAVTNKGYILTSSSELVSEDMLCRAMRTDCGQCQVHVFELTDSTNLQAKKLVLDRKAGHGSLVFANQQTAGRGRLGRDFHSPRNGIYMSLVIEPEFDMSHSGLVTVSAASAVAEALSQVCGIDARIKWVNDVYADGKKVCGILTEAMTDFETGAIGALIIGIGINTNTDDFPEKIRDIAGAVSLENAKAKAALIAKISQLVLENVQQIGSSRPAFMKTYRDRSMVLGKNITVYKGKYREDPTVEIGGIKAKAMAIDDEGGLLVKYRNGKEETLTTGEVSVRV
ncbi:MAG: biotin--[acetyl-CoA-carboxylase] ligase [Clostridia bacterium]|nr:biotin--[acetyl-CoA-carboxylase] ligase [Clostridia bacterium]